MNRRIQVSLFFFAIILLALAVSGVGNAALAAVGVEPDSVQLADAILGLAGLVPLVLLWMADQRREQLAAARVSVVLVAEDGRRLELGYHPPRREVTTRQGLFGVLGGIASSRRFDMGHALLRIIESGAYEALVDGRLDTIEIPCPSKELDEFNLDNEAFLRGEVRKNPPPPPPKPAKELVEILEAVKALQDKVDQLKADG